MVFQRPEPGQTKAGVLALLVHLGFVVLLVFGVSWQNREPPGVEVELWAALPDNKPAKPAPPVHKPEPTPEPKPKPEPRPEPKPKPAPEPKPEISKAEIELKAKEQKRKEEEKKKKQEEELEKKQAELKKKEEDKKKKEEEKKKTEQEQRDRDKKAQQAKAEADKAAEAARAQKAAQQAADAQNAAMGKQIDGYVDKIKAKIKSKVILPPDLSGNPQAEFDVILMPTGEVLDIKLTRSSGSSAYDSAVERAIAKAVPLPLPPDPALFSKFRNLHLKFRPHEE